MSITITDDVLQALGLSDQDVLQHVALLLYQQHRLSMEQACRLAGISEDAFQRCVVASRASDSPAPPTSHATIIRHRAHPRITGPAFISNLSFDAQHLYVRIATVYEVAIALRHIPPLEAATEEQRRHWALCDHGTRIWWPDIEYSLSLADVLARCEP